MLAVLIEYLMHREIWLVASLLVNKYKVLLRSELQSPSLFQVTNQLISRSLTH